jgi:DNA-binding NtrC family response regulator
MVRGIDTSAAAALTWSQVHAFRMARHHLDRPAPKAQVARVVADSCGVQAQVMAAAQLALRVRIRGLTLEDVEREVILNAIEEAGGNKTRAAERLDISTRTIRNKVKKYVADGYLEENYS